MHGNCSFLGRNNMYTFNLWCRFAMPGGAEPPKTFAGGVNSPEGYLLGLWVHECRRVFADKLVSQEDKGWVDKAITDLCRQEFPPELCKQVRMLCCLSLYCTAFDPVCQVCCHHRNLLAVASIPPRYRWCAPVRFIPRSPPAAAPVTCAPLCCCCSPQVDEPLYFVDFLR
jgi:hypothetical protein